MFRNISLGQYIPDDSLLHRLDPRSKVLATLFFILAIFAASSPLELALVYPVGICSIFIS